MSRTPSPVAVSTAALASIADRGVPVPSYDRSRLRPRIVHVGVGGFHRAHMALYTDELAASGSEWGIRGLGLLAQDAAMASALGDQDYLYTLTEKGSGSYSPRVVGSIIDFVFAADDVAAAVSAIADPDTAILSLTITEAGYSEPTDGRPTTFDQLAGCLDRRRRAGLGPITILSCDNLPGNGDAARRAMLDAAARHSDQLCEWVSVGCSFPNSMVDRITPTTTDTDREWLLETFGIVDRWPVVAERFRQWVVEDHFVAGRPAWEEAGVLFTDEVNLWELYKLRFLNAGHSCIAYLSSLAGITFVDEAMSTPVIATYLDELLRLEALPTVAVIDGHPREDYIRIVLDRFANTGVRDQIARLCMDGTAKYPTFLIPTIVGQLRLGGPIERATLALAGWSRYLAVTPRDEQAFDASGEEPREFSRAALTDPLSFLEFASVFPAELATNARFRDAFRVASDRLAQVGPLQAMMELNVSR